MNTKRFLSVIFFLLAVPVVTIAAINVLFGQEIAVDVATWAACLWLIILFTPKQPPRGGGYGVNCSFRYGRN